MHDILPEQSPRWQYLRHATGEFNNDQELKQKFLNIDDCFHMIESLKEV